MRGGHSKFLPIASILMDHSTWPLNKRSKNSYSKGWPKHPNPKTQKNEGTRCSPQVLRKHCSLYHWAIRHFNHITEVVPLSYQAFQSHQQRIFLEPHVWECKWCNVSNLAYTGRGFEMTDSVRPCTLLIILAELDGGLKQGWPVQTG